MKRKPSTEKPRSPPQLLLEINKLISTLECDRTIARSKLEHVKRDGPVNLGKGSTILGDCADDCPACAAEDWFGGLGFKLGSLQRKVHALNAEAVLRRQAGLQKAQNKAADNRKKRLDQVAKVVEDLTDGMRTQKQRLHKLDISGLKVSEPTLRKIQRRSTKKKK